MNTAFNDGRTTAPRWQLNQELKDMSNNNVATKAMRKAIRKSQRTTVPVERKAITYSGTMFSRTVEYKPTREAVGYALFDISSNVITASNSISYRDLYSPCRICGDIHFVSVLTFRSGVGNVCPSCMEHVGRCQNDCGEYIVLDLEFPGRHHVQLRSGAHGYVCESCYQRRYTKCGVCNTRTHIQQTSIANGKRVCRRCMDEMLNTNNACHSCGTYVPKESVHVMNGHFYCASCYVDQKEYELRRKYRRPAKPINGYSHSDGRIFVSTEGGAIRYYGLELEADNGIEDTDDQSPDLLGELSPWVEFILKSDGSINGFETVSVPLTLNYIRNHLRLKEWCEIMKRYDFDGDSPDNHAGMHVHISKAAFGDSVRKQNRAISAFLYLFNRREFRTQIKEFSRRRGDFNYCGFYDRCIDYSTTTITRALPLAITENREYRNRMINFHVGSTDPQTGRHVRVENEATVEVRLFKGSLRRSTIIAAVELIDLFADIAIGTWTEDSLRALTWKDICAKVPATSSCLKQYLKRHNIWEE